MTLFDPLSPESVQVHATVNGVSSIHVVEARDSLADFLRGPLRLTGTHVGCEQGVCGACTVLVDGVSARSCLMLACQADGAQVLTVESLAHGGRLNDLQQAFCDHHGLQCGFCTPGILMTLTELLAGTPEPDEAQVREVLSGHLCRCTGYENIVRAALAAVRMMNGASA
jgi:aerobic-type carbon monoxide dehydrogenase small subunit (CoxS/CutS family)